MLAPPFHSDTQAGAQAGEARTVGVGGAQICPLVGSSGNLQAAQQQHGKFLSH